MHIGCTFRQSLLSTASSLDQPCCTRASATQCIHGPSEGCSSMTCPHHTANRCQPCQPSPRPCPVPGSQLTAQHSAQLSRTPGRKLRPGRLCEHFAWLAGLRGWSPSNPPHQAPGQQACCAGGFCQAPAGLPRLVPCWQKPVGFCRPAGPCCEPGWRGPRSPSWLPGRFCRPGWGFCQLGVRRQRSWRRPTA